MNDRELLRYAAKAFGVEVWTDIDGNLYTETGHPDYGGERPWHPLSDDGDALRLAVKLGLFIDSYAPATTVGNVICPSSLACKTRMEEHNGDQYAATRRAIVRAAAEIGKEQP